MCMQCHSFLSDTQVLAELNQSLNSEKEEFDQWNTTSVSHVLIAMSGHNGPVCKKVAIKLLQRFLNWYKKNKKDNYYPRCGIEKMYPKKCYSSIIKIANDNPDMEKKELLTLFSKEIEAETKKIKRITETLETRGISRYDFSDIKFKNKYVVIGSFIIAIGMFYYLW